MLLFPQLLSGATVQFPLVKAYSCSSITNLQEDGSRYASGGTNPLEIRWTLTYNHLTQTEADALRLFFVTTMGKVLPFIFLDPINNLLAWSEDLSQPIWAKSPLLAATVSHADGYTAIAIGNSGTGPSQASQSLQCPALALICFSVYARADQPVSLVLSIDNVQQTFALSTQWKQYFLTQSGTGTAETKLLTLSVGSGQAQVSRITASAQLAPALYTVTQDISGVMPKTRFDQDSISFTASRPDDLSCEVRLSSRLT